MRVGELGAIIDASVTNEPEATLEPPFELKVTECESADHNAFKVMSVVSAGL